MADADRASSASMGLLEDLTAHPLDEDYAVASARRRTRQEPGTRARTPSYLAVCLVLGAFGLLLAVAAIQTDRSAPTRQSSRESLVSQVTALRGGLDDARTQVAGLRADVAGERALNQEATQAASAAEARVDRLGAQVGTVPVSGPGVRVVVDDNPNAASVRQSVLDTDLQRLVNGLWVAGAEAVSVNGRRVTSRTAIRQAGQAITVNYVSLRRPYTVLATGDPDTLEARFLDTEAGSYWLDVEEVFGLQFDLSREETVSVPAVSPPLLRHAEPLPTRTERRRDGQGGS